MRHACILLALALTAGAQSLPESEVARARRLLESPQWRDKAWGAYYAGSLHSDELKESLLEAFRGATALRDAASYTEEHAYLATLFDAAIQSGITVPAELLEPFEAHWYPPAIILLARDPTSEDTLLRVREKVENVEWLAVNNLLLGRKSQRFFAKTLSDVEIVHTFTLQDPDDNSGSGSGTGGGVFGDGVLVMPKGFPPVGIYGLVDFALAGDVLLARGPTDAYYRRFVVPTNKQIASSLGRESIERNKLRIQYLATLEQPHDQPAESIFHAQTSIQVQNDAQLHQQWDTALQAQEAAIRAFVRSAQDRGLGSVTGMTLKIVPQVNDRRKTTSSPIPPLTPREFVLD
jgi:hypothetical protein